MVFIYIPLWFYSNGVTQTSRECDKIIYIPLWFYSNQVILFTNDQISIYLHSTMVLFKSIVAVLTAVGTLLFTFHYGSIQILYRFRVKMHTIKIYIPLWFYSNLRIIIYSLVFWTFTFHYGSIQIRDNVLFFAHCYHLHSTMVLFKLIHIGMIILLLHIYIPLWFYSNLIVHLYSSYL